LARPGRIAFPVIIALGAITGVLTYMIFNQAAPGPIFSTGFSENPATGVPSGTMQEGGATGGLTTTAGSEGKSANSTGQNKSGSAAIPKDAMVISIPQGASQQGNPSYDPEIAQASIDKTVAWKNDDSTPHTATSGDKKFDSSIINPGDSYTIPARNIGAGEHAYTCTIHPYMKGTLVIK